MSSPGGPRIPPQERRSWSQVDMDMTNVLSVIITSILLITQESVGGVSVIAKFPDLLFYDYQHWALSLGSEA